MGAFDCPVCGAVRHIDDNASPECCWYCRWPVDAKRKPSDQDRRERLRGARRRNPESFPR